MLLGVAIDVKMTFEKRLRSVSSAAAQWLGIMRKSWQVFHDRSLLLRSFWSFVLPVLEYCSTVWCSAADSHRKLLDRVVRSAGFLAGGVLDCNLAHRRSVAELCMLFKIKSNAMLPLSGALPLPYVPARVTRGALVAHRHSFATPRCRTSQYLRTFVPLSVSLWNDLSDLCLMVWDWRVSRAEPMLSCWHNLFFLFRLLLFYLLLTSMGWLCGVGVFRLIECSHSFRALHSGLQIIIIIISGVQIFLQTNCKLTNGISGVQIFLQTNCKLTNRITRVQMFLQTNCKLTKGTTGVRIVPQTNCMLTNDHAVVS